MAINLYNKKLREKQKKGYVVLEINYGKDEDDKLLEKKLKKVDSKLNPSLLRLM